MKPNAALEPLAFLIGDWETVGTHPMVPGEKLHGRTSFAWHEGRSFILMRNHVDHPDFPDGMAIIGSDDQAASFGMIYYDERGTSRIMEVTAGEGSFQWRRENPEFSQTLTIVADGPDHMTSTGRMSKNGGPWEDDLSQRFVRDGALDEGAGEP